MLDHAREAATTDVAIIGMAGRFPGAPTVDDFWRLLRDGRRGIRTLSEAELRRAGVDEATLREPSYVRAGAPLEGFDLFDAEFFGFSPRDAAIVDPQHRHFLECAWEALESAGYTPGTFDATVGVFGGSGMHAYLMYNLLTNPDLVRSVGMFLLRHTGNDKDFLTTRASYLLDLQGPSVNVQTACSTSLVAVHLACQSLLGGECDLALAGGVTIEVPHGQGYHYREGEILSPDGYCRAFDARAGGTVFGSGVGIVVLRRLEEALAAGDTIRAVIKGTAVNNDGALKAGYLAPSVEGQARAVAEALAVARVDPATIGYVEAHGTGTPLGDPIEVTALTSAFRESTDRRGFCMLGSAKTNVGHLDTAAGVAGLAKTILALENDLIPATVGFEAPNPAIELSESPFVVSGEARLWPRGTAPRRAGVNSLGVGGTNAFAVLEEAPPSIVAPRRRPAELLVLSARTPAALDAATARLAHHFAERSHENLADVAYTLQVGRKAFPHRRIVVARDGADATTVLADDARRTVSGRAPAVAPSVAFLFAGGGAQRPGMGRELYCAEPAFRQASDECLSLLPPELAARLRTLLHDAGEDAAHQDSPDQSPNGHRPTERHSLDAGEALLRPSLGLPALFVTQYALARLWMTWGIQPAAMVGHSVGEYVAACLSGVLTLEDALGLVVERGRLFETLPAGAMLSVELPEDDLWALLPPELSVAAVNAPGLCVASGPTAGIEALEEKLAARGIGCARLRIAVAAHSPYVEPILAAFEERVASVGLRAPRIPYVSTLTGTWISASDVTDPRYWTRQLRETVRFSDALDTLCADDRVMVEVGPGRALATLAQQRATSGGAGAAIASLGRVSGAAGEVVAVLEALGRLWLHGVGVDWPALYPEQRRRRIPLPTYPFERRRHWIEPGRPSVALDSARVDQSASVPAPVSRRRPFDEWFSRPVWRKDDRAAPSFPTPARRECWLLLTDEGPLAGALATCLRGQGQTVIEVVAGNGYERGRSRGGVDRHAVRPDVRSDWSALLDELQGRGAIPDRIVHLWSLSGGGGPDRVSGGIGRYDDVQQRGFFNLLALTQALGEMGSVRQTHLAVVTEGLIALDGERASLPERATLLGPVRVAPREAPGLSCQLLDVTESDGKGDAGVALAVGDAADLAARLVSEIGNPTPDSVVVFRGADRWVERFEPAAISAAPPAPPVLRERGVYLIAGGTGGIGLEIAEYLARTVRARLVLMSRRAVANSHDGYQTGPCADGHANGVADRSTSTHGRLHWHGGARMDRDGGLSEHVQRLEALGAEVMRVAADVTDPSSVVTALARVRERFGSIHGVVHAAGVLDDAPMLTRTADDAARVLAPKVRGTLVLDAAMAGARLDFFALCSSTSALLGPPGQVDYVAANAFLDAFAQGGASAASERVIAIDWGVWKGVGMAARLVADMGPAANGTSMAAVIGPAAGESHVASTTHPHTTLTTGHERGSPNGHEGSPVDGRDRASGAFTPEHERSTNGHVDGPGNGRDKSRKDGRVGPSGGAPARPLLGECVEASAERLVYRARYTLDSSWVLAEHCRPSGEAILPGLAYLELLTDAVEPWATGRPLEVRDLVLSSPLVVRPGEAVEVQLAAERAPDGSARVVVESAADAVRRISVEHARATIAFGAATSGPERLNVPATGAFAAVGAPRRTAILPGQTAGVAFGPRWQCLRAVRQGDGIVEAEIALDPRFVGDLEAYPLHPALLDMALTQGLTLIPGYQNHDFYVPLSWSSARVFGPLGPQLASRSVLRGGSPEHGLVEFDVTVTDPEGRPLVEVERFTMKRADPGAVVGPPARRARMTGQTRLTGLVERGITPAEGVEAFARILGQPELRRVVVSPVSIGDLLGEIDGSTALAHPASVAADSNAVSAHAPSATAAPRTPTERALAAIWRDLLGTPGAGIDDDFFDLGGHSLIAVRLLARVRRELGVDLGLDAFFRASTIRGLGALVDLHGPVPAAALPGHHVDAPVPPRSSPRGWSPLVQIADGPARPPFFCVHGAGGNVVMLRGLARQLGEDEAFYGLQAVGVDGRRRPLRSVEEMAALYLGTVRDVQPSGPYLLGGYSGGGVIAYEMAQRLLEAGERIELLVMIDTFAQVLLPRRDPVRTLREILTQGPRRVRRIPRQGVDMLTAAARRALIAGYEAAGRPIPHELRWAWLWEANLAALRAYQPRPYAGRVTLLRATVDDALHQYHEHDLGWSSWVTGGVEVKLVPGTHYTMLDVPNVQVLASHLRHELERARENSA